MRKCDDTYITAAGKKMRCRRNAVTRRRQWYFGKGSKVVNCCVNLCARCAEIYDDHQAEGEWEARVS